jgi:integrase
LYNTGARADEVAQLKIKDLDVAYNSKKDFSIVLIRRKGDKLRRCPLWHDTVSELTSLIEERGQDEHVFLNRHKEPITRFGIHILVKRHIKKLLSKFPSLEKKRVSPHTIRHTTQKTRCFFELNCFAFILG